MVWDNILIHVLDKIHISMAQTPVPPQHRIWWYPTGPLTFIPICAAGPRSGTIDVTQLVISSYVTTLQSLFQSQTKRGPISKGQQKILGISQPQTPGQSSLPQTIEEVNGVVQMFRSSGSSEKDIVCLRGSEATVDGV
jgi:hypothetical protein